MGRRLPTLLVVVAILTALAAVRATGSAQRLELVRSDPGAGETLGEPPDRLRLWFSVPPESAVSLIRLEGPDGVVELGDPEAAEDDSLVAEVLETLAPGDYTVRWRTSSGQARPVRGSFGFTVAGPGPSPSPRSSR